jgi:uncharacterized protein (TIGR03000 family)
MGGKPFRTALRVALTGAAVLAVPALAAGQFQGGLVLPNAGAGYFAPNPAFSNLPYGAVTRMYTALPGITFGQTGLPGDPLATPSPANRSALTTQEFIRSAVSSDVPAVPVPAVPPIPGRTFPLPGVVPPLPDTAPLAEAATLDVQVPADAEVWVQGRKTTLTGRGRRFQSPPLQPGFTYKYEVQARWTENGAELTQVRTVRVRPGQTEVVAFGEDQDEK